jgi:hypothetical protein
MYTELPFMEYSISGPVVVKLRQRDRAPKLSGSKFIKQAGSHSVDSHPKAEPQNKGGFPIPFRAGYRNGGRACLIHGHILFHWLF